MRVKKGFINRNVCGESVLLATGQENIDFTNIISLNETANFLWNELAQREEFTIDDMVPYRQLPASTIIIYLMLFIFTVVIFLPLGVNLNNCWGLYGKV